MKFERQGVIHEGMDGISMSRTTLCEWESLLFTAQDLLPVNPELLTTCVACLAARFRFQAAYQSGRL